MKKNKMKTVIILSGFATMVMTGCGLVQGNFGRILENSATNSFVETDAAT